jgi:hypothetical protein
VTAPVIAGFYPDPSVCRAGDAYYLANSSFEFVPGVPVWRSADLLSWTQAGNALTRPAQLPEHPGAASTGIYAPTLRHHGGRFWLVTTNVLEVRRGQLIVTAEQAEGPWSDPVYVTGAIGIDPDLAWDEDGTCHLTWASALPTLYGIASVPINPATGAMLAEPRLLWNGTGLAHPEGPHLYRTGGWWYLLLAEGGTERGHAVTIARARTLDGPFEPAPRNPILTHRSTSDPVQSTGHADLVELADGSWAMVYLGTRPHGQTPGYHVLGRETFLAGVDWVDGWPVIDEERYQPGQADHSFTDQFGSASLHPRWVSPGAGPRTFSQPDSAGHLALTAPASRTGATLLLTRVRDLTWTAEASLDVSRGAGRFLVRVDDRHWYGLTASPDGVEAVVAIGPAVTVPAWLPHPPGGVVTLRITARTPSAPNPYLPPSEPDLIELAVVDADGAARTLASVDGRYLSTEVAGGFTGRMVGVELLQGQVIVREVSYASCPG